MTAARWERVLWMVAVLAGGYGLHGARSAIASTPRPAGALAPPVALREVDPEAAFKAAEYISQHDPFRTDRKPAAVVYSPVADGAPPPPPAPPKPTLVVRGILGGAPTWEAILDGVPGREGSVVVHTGDRYAGLTIKRVTRDTVVVRGADTTWTLTVKQAW